MIINKIFKFKKNISKNKIDNFDRKIIHVLSAIIICFFPYIFSLNQIIFISLLFVLIFSIARFFKFLPIINRVKRLSWGEVFYPLGVMLVAIFFLPEGLRAFQFGVLVLGFSDSLANIFGDLFGVHRIKLLGGAKSLEGSLVFLLTTFFLLIIFHNNMDFYSINSYFIIALGLTLVEFALFFGLDNFVLPSLAAYLFSLL